MNKTGNQLDELSNEHIDEGQDTRVIAKQIPVQLSTSEKLIPIVINLVGIGLAGVGLLINQWPMLLIGLVIIFAFYLHMGNITSHFNVLEQRINSAASEIDNYMEQRVIILENLVGLVNRAVDLDKEIMLGVSKYRSGIADDSQRNEVASQMNEVSHNINFALENYPELKAHQAIQEAIQQNAYLQKEITAARSLYNDAVYSWNREIFDYPFKKIVAARNGYTTRIPFITDEKIRQRARDTFF